MAISKQWSASEKGIGQIRRRITAGGKHRVARELEVERAGIGT
jgi:hypothetical protein